ncbi:MAG: glycosyltransferase family 1 protein [Deltaproteobacteria bacterium]|nr:MAG: glycosyltransferase family 1 protein [Deltaproteobacteria bacterium]
MARIVLTSSGSTGDVNPIVAVAVELHARGHRVSLVLEQRLCASIARLGIAVRPMAGDLDAFFRKHIGTILRAAFPETASTATSLFVRDYLVPNFEAQLRVLREACSDADVLVAPWLHHAASAAAEVAGVPWVTLVYSPILWMPANRFTWALGKQMFGSILDDPVNALRARFGLPRRRHLAHEGSLSP